MLTFTIRVQFFEYFSLQIKKIAVVERFYAFLIDSWSERLHHPDNDKFDLFPVRHSGNLKVPILEGQKSTLRAS